MQATLPYSPASPEGNDPREQESATSPYFQPREQEVLKSDCSEEDANSTSDSDSDSESSGSAELMACDCSSCFSLSIHDGWTAAASSSSGISAQMRCTTTSGNFTSGSDRCTTTSGNFTSGSDLTTDASSIICPPKLKRARRLSPYSRTNEDSRDSITERVNTCQSLDVSQGSDNDADGEASDDDEARYNKTRRTQYSYTTHTTRRETVAPEQLAVDIRDSLDTRGEAACRTPSPVRNGYLFDPSAEVTNYKLYERAEVAFHFRRERTAARKEQAREREAGLEAVVNMQTPDTTV